VTLMTQGTTHLASLLDRDLGIDQNYKHGPKHVIPGEPLEKTGLVLKWYAIHPQDRHIPDEITKVARAYLNSNPLEARGFGFVLLHRCGNDFYFLIVSTWRNNNELWETVFYKDGDAMTDFAPWPRDGAHKPTFCVWEMAPVFHEQKAWERFLKSSRDERAAQAWLSDRYSGEA
jgi:hypothetical protein